MQKNEEKKKDATEISVIDIFGGMSEDRTKIKVLGNWIIVIHPSHLFSYLLPFGMILVLLCALLEIMSAHVGIRVHAQPPGIFAKREKSNCCFVRKPSPQVSIHCITESLIYSTNRV